MLETMTTQKNGRWIRSNKVIFFCIVSMLYLSWTCSFFVSFLLIVFSDKNPQRRRLIERYHRYIAKDEVKKPDPWAEADTESDEAAAASVAAAAAAAISKAEEASEAIETPVELQEPVLMPMEETKRTKRWLPKSLPLSLPVFGTRLAVPSGGFLVINEWFLIIT